MKFYCIIVSIDLTQRYYKEISNCRESGRDGSFFGELMVIRFSSPDLPEMSLQADLLTANSAAIKASKC